jgi:hypothetical protein
MHKLRTRTKLKKTANFRADIEFDTFWHHFLLNERVRFVQNNVVSSTVHIINKTKNSVVLNSTMYLILPLDMQRQGKKKNFPLQRLSLSLS